MNSNGAESNQVIQEEPVITQDQTPQKLNTKVEVDSKNGTNTQSNKDLLNTEVAKLSPEDQKKWSEFNEILNSKNDNDPRIDTSLKHMSQALHDVIIKKYQEIPPEQHNERGLVTFLISRDLQSAQDMEFIKSVYNEKPCLSLANCSVADPNPDPHHSSANNTTLDYQQLAALYQLEAQLNKNPDLIRDPKFRAMIDAAAMYDSPAVKRKAEELKARY